MDEKERPDKNTARRQEVIRAAKFLADTQGVRTMSMAEFCRATGIPKNRIVRLFDNWNELCRRAGIEPKRGVMRLSDDDIFTAMRDAFLEIGGLSGRTRFDHHFRYDLSVFQRRGMSWPQALFAFRQWATEHAPDFPYMDALPESMPQRAEDENAADAPEPPSWPQLGGEALGEMINFRGLMHAPVNEQGVVMLFAMVARELGYAIEAVQTGFPDCRAKRRVAGDRWELVRVEFEYRSRSFERHGHDARGCDVIVCWEDNWPGCPLEVLELRTAIAALGLVGAAG